MSLSIDDINKLLAEDANKPKRGGGPRVDPTEDRTIPVWYKLPHHLCTRDCDHRKESSNSGNACWNPDCKDPRERTDMGVNIVSEVKKRWICRYCFLDGYLQGPAQLSTDTEVTDATT